MTTLALKGDVGREVAALFIEQLAAIGHDDNPLTLDMRETDLGDDGATTVLLVDSIRQAAARVGSLQILSPPQALAHCLYRIGILESGSTIQIIEPREEIGSAS